MDTITLDKETAMKVLTVLEHSLPSEMCAEAERSKLLDYTYELIDMFADHYQLQTDDGFVDPITLKFTEFK